MNLEQAARVLVEAQGECWHYWERCKEWDEDTCSFTYFWECKNCTQRHYGTQEGLEINPDPTSSDFWMKVWNWAKGQEWWDDFLFSNGIREFDYGVGIPHESTGRYGILVDLIGSPDFLIELAEFVEGRKK